jgi:hypothetical protein
MGILFVEGCKTEYERKKDHFLGVIQYSDSLMDRWWAGEDFPNGSEHATTQKAKKVME